MKTVDPLAVASSEAGRRTVADLFWVRPDRRIILGVSILAALLFIALLTLVLDPNGRIAGIVLDRKSPHFPYPFTIQNITHILLFVGLGELFVRWRTANFEMAFLKMGLLPEDEETILEGPDLGPIHRRIVKLYGPDGGILPSLIDVSILQFQSGRSIDQTVSVMNSSLELIQHRVDLSYSLVRYIAWLIPTMGFIGTVIGIGAALAHVPASGDINMPELAHQLSVGFDCTMVALVESALLVFCLHLAQEKEELAVNLAGTYTLRNLINRLYTRPT